MLVLWRELRSWIVLCRAYNLMLLLNAHPRYTGPWHLHNFSHFTFHEVTTCRPGQMPASDWSILPHHWPLIGRHWLSCDPWWQVAARRRMVVSDSDSSGVTLATSEPLTSGWGHKLAPMLWWSVPEPFHGAGMLVSHQGVLGERCQGYIMWRWG